MQLVSERCTIRPWRLEDAESLAKHANNRKVWLGLRDLFPHPYTIPGAQEFLQRGIGDRSTTKFCIEFNARAVGGMGIRPGEDVHSYTATLGYWLGEEFWERGIMTEAVAALTDFCFDNLPLRRISAEVFANNPASARVLEKAGFRLRRPPREVRYQRGKAPRFTALREDEGEICRRCARAEYPQPYLAV